MKLNRHTPGCQHFVAQPLASEGVRCGVPTNTHRSCGYWRGGCMRVIAYCAEHGGDIRAVREMAQHIEMDHTEPSYKEAK